MAWTRIDDKFLNNIKIQKAGALGMALYLAGLIHCNTNLTDGFIDEDVLPSLYGMTFQSKRNRSAEKLVELKLWHKVQGGYEVNDFLDFNRSKEQIEVIKSKRAESGSKGGSNRTPNIEAKAEQTDKQIAKQIAKQNDKQLLSINTLSPNTLIPNELKQPQQQLNARNAFSAYQNGIGLLNGHIAELLKQAVDEFSDEWVTAAIEEAVEQNKRNWRYIEAILKRWQIDGFKVDTRVKKPNNGYKPTKQLSAGLDEILAGAPIFAEDK
ncbi:MAG: DnaD domain protein [Bacteroidales bacterium]|jgi:DnaD/phage-associated family protein